MTQSIRKTRKAKGGGIAFGRKKVTASFAENKIKCDLCENSTFELIVGSIGKSKVKQVGTQLVAGFFGIGEAAEIVDTTSVVMLMCNKCTQFRMFRNQDTMPITINESN